METKSNDIELGFDLIASFIDVISNVTVNIDFFIYRMVKHALKLAQEVDAKLWVCFKQIYRENHNVNNILRFPWPFLSMHCILQT